MGTRVTRCPFCKKSVNNKKRECKNTSNKDVRCITSLGRHHSKNITRYKCINYEGHGYYKETNPIESKKWFYVTFEDRYELEDRVYFYKDSQLYSTKQFIQKVANPILSLSPEKLKEPLPAIVEEIKHLTNQDKLNQFIAIHFPWLLKRTAVDRTTLWNDPSLKDLHIFLLFLSGCSQTLIQRICKDDFYSRATVSQTIERIKKHPGLNILDFSFNREIKFYVKEDKVILSDYYNKYDKSDFTILNPSNDYRKLRPRHAHLFGGGLRYIKGVKIKKTLSPHALKEPKDKPL